MKSDHQLLIEKVQNENPKVQNEKSTRSMAEIPNKGGRYGWNSFKKVVAMAEIIIPPKKGGRYGWSS